MPRSSEEISNYNSGSSGRTDANLANDSNHLGGIPADEYATQEYVQRYHNTKEAAQKEYIDEKDSTGLNSAKAYTDLMINNQDFSGFAQKTDVLALQQDTANKLAQCQTTCANNLENTRQQIVSDVNAGFDDVGQSISQLNANQQQLFTSVSNGKAKVAAAITGKGVTTASDATYETMASNIRNIETGGGGEVDPNYMNTSDATVNEGDIALGKTAYARGNKLYGTHVCEDSSDANAAASDILLGKSAYVNGEKIYGSLIPQAPISQPTYGLDTSDATATTSDVRNGKTFYARGQKLVGTAAATGVEEIYGINIDQLEYNNLYGLSNYDEIADVTITKRRLLKFSKNLDYCVCCSEIDGATYIESYAINEQGIYIQGTTGASGNTSYKKYRYSLNELGIDSDEIITDLEFTKAGIFDSDKICLLVVLSRKQTETDQIDSYTHNPIWNQKMYIRLFTYNLRENGVIGKMYTSQNLPETYKELLYEFTSRYSYDYNGGEQTMRAASFNNRDDKLFVIRGTGNSMYNMNYTLYDITILNLPNGLYLSKSTYSYSNSSSYVYNVSPSARFALTQDDRFALFESASYNSVLIYNDFTDSTTYTPKCGQGSSYDIGSHIPGTNKFISTGGGLYQIRFNENMMPIGTDLIGSANFRNMSGNTIGSVKAWKIVGNNIVLFSQHTANYTDGYKLYLYRYNLQDFLNATADSSITELNAEDELLITSGSEAASTVNYSRKIVSNINNSKIFTYTDESYTTAKKGLSNIAVEEDLTNIVGLSYNGNYYYRQDPHILTAGQPDVRAGKTFIGWMGTQETGTMEVE